MHKKGFSYIIIEYVTYKFFRQVRDVKCNKCGRELNRKKVCPVCGKNESPTNISSRGDKSTLENYEYTLEYGKSAPSLDLDEITIAASTVYDGKLENKKQAKSFFIGFLITILVIGAVVFATYYAYSYFMGNSTEEYITAVSKINTRINIVNDDMVAVLKKGSNAFPVSDILKQIPEANNALNKIIENTSSIPAPSNYSSAHSKLIEAVKLNKQIYQQLEIILKNPTNSEVQKNKDALVNYTDQCMNNYTSIRINNFNFTLPNEIIDISAKTTPWIKQKQAEYSQVTSLIATFSKYFENISKIVLSYDGLKVDFTQALKKAQNDKTEWDNFFVLIDNNEKTVKDIKTNYEKISVPSQLKAFNSSFAPILDDTLTYYSKLRFAAQSEKDIKKEGMSPSELAKKMIEVEALYQDAEKSNTSSVMGYQRFAPDLSAQKDKFINPEYVLTLKTTK